MARYLVRRLVQNLLILCVTTLMAFTLMRLVPGGPEQFLFNPNDPNIRPEDKAALRESFGLNDPILVQYGKWATNLVRGDWGRSYVDQRPVLEKIAERLPATIQLNLAALLIGLLGIPAGVIAAVNRGSWLDRALAFATSGLNAAPNWWLGLLALVFIAAPTGLFPLGGMFTIGRQSDFGNRLWHLMLPALITALVDWIVLYRFMRTATLESLRQDFVRTARAKGASAQRVLWSHAVRNSLVPLAPIFVGSIIGLITGNVFIENVFSWPGIGRMAVTSTFQRDFPVVMGLFTLGSMLTVIGLLLADVVVALVDPRVKFR